jgi:hypothetical protein
VVERLLGFVGGDVLAGGFGELGLFLLLALAFEGSEVVSDFRELAIEARFLDAQVVELAVIGEVGVSLDEAGAELGGLVVELVGKLDAGESIDAVFETGNAGDAPLGVSDCLDQRGFLFANGVERLDAVQEFGFVEFGVVAGKQDGVAGEARFSKHCGTTVPCLQPK